MGIAGAGKSTLAVKLGAAIDAPVFHLDAIYWRTGEPADVVAASSGWHESHDRAAPALADGRALPAHVHGRAVDDGLVALRADAHGARLLTLDARVRTTYRRLGVAFTSSDG